MSVKRVVAKSAEALDDQVVAFFPVSRVVPSKSGGIDDSSASILLGLIAMVAALVNRGGPDPEDSVLVFGNNHSWIVKLPSLPLFGHGEITFVRENASTLISIEQLTALDVEVTVNGDRWYVFGNHLRPLRTAAAAVSRQE